MSSSSCKANRQEHPAAQPNQVEACHAHQRKAGLGGTQHVQSPVRMVDEGAAAATEGRTIGLQIETAHKIRMFVERVDADVRGERSRPAPASRRGCCRARSNSLQPPTRARRKRV